MPALKGHSAIKINDETIMIFGGYNQIGQITDTCILIDIGSIGFLEIPIVYLIRKQENH